MLHIIEDSNNPALGLILKALRDQEQQVGRQKFRHNVRLLGTLLGYELGKSLASHHETVQSPFGEAQVETLLQNPVLATALRAGLPFLEGMLEIFAESDTMFFGAARREEGAPGPHGGMQVDIGYYAMASCQGRDVIFVDPMIATGSTAIDIYRLLCQENQKPGRFLIAGLIGWRGAYDRIVKEIPEAELWLVTCDDDLDDKGYIIPGLGDAGDLSFGRKI